jgi:hypothetical protein
MYIFLLLDISRSTSFISCVFCVAPSSIFLIRLFDKSVIYSSTFLILLFDKSVILSSLYFDTVIAYVTYIIFCIFDSAI